MSSSATLDGKHAEPHGLYPQSLGSTTTERFLPNGSKGCISRSSQFNADRTTSISSGTSTGRNQDLAMKQNPKSQRHQNASCPKSSAYDGPSKPSPNPSFFPFKGEHQLADPTLSSL
ncbi:hypothetical protein SLA2020_338780 [Shorea laevis]